MAYIAYGVLSWRLWASRRRLPASRRWLWASRRLSCAPASCRWLAGPGRAQNIVTRRERSAGATGSSAWGGSFCSASDWTWLLPGMIGRVGIYSDWRPPHHARVPYAPRPWCEVRGIWWRDALTLGFLVPGLGPD